MKQNSGTHWVHITATKERTRVRRDIARDYPVTPMGHSSLKENKWAGPGTVSGPPTQGDRFPSRQSLPAWLE